MKPKTMAAVSIAMAVLAGGLIDGKAQAASLYSSGTKTWDTSTANWGTGPGGPYNAATWNNATPDSAILEGASGTVTVAEAINIGSLTVSTNDYTITGNTLAFGVGGTLNVSGLKVTIESGITGQPTVNTSYINGWGTSYGGAGLQLNPTSSSMHLGALVNTVENYMYIGGAAGTSNSIASISAPRRNKLTWNGAGTWTVGDAYSGEFYINSGTLIANGKLSADFTYIALNTGATLHYNNPGVIGSQNMFRFQGGSLDNSSGAPITSSTYNYNYSLYGNLTFIGSQGANSDLNLGTGAATMNAARTITVSNAAATLTIGGAIGDSGWAYGLTKAGAGTLKLTATNTYTGETVVNAGTLSITKTYLSDIATVRIADGATLNLDYVGTDTVFQVYTNGVVGPTGTWGGLTSSADNKTALITGAGMLNVPVPTVLAGIRYWDGGTMNIPGTGNALSAGGSGTWSTSVKNWDCGAGVAYTNWNNATNDTAVFKGTPGTVTLAEDITLGGILIDDVEGYTIQGNTLHFAPGGSITNTRTINENGATKATIASGITGAPAVKSFLGVNTYMAFAPTTGSVSLGLLTGPGAYKFAGTANGTIAGFSGAKTRWSGSGTWTVAGDVNEYEHWFDSGTVIVNGLLRGYSGLWLSGGTVVVNGTKTGPAFTFLGAATVGGTGVIYGSETIPAGSTVAPGYPTGTLTITNNCTINGNLGITVAGTQNSKLAVGGTLNVTNATLNVTVNGMPVGPVVIATYNSLVQPFAATNGADNFTIDYQYKGSNVIVLVPPARGFVLIVN